MAVRHTKILIIEENSWVPIDRRVWQEATTLRDAGAQVFVICPMAKGSRAVDAEDRELPSDADDVDGISVYRFPLTFAEGGLASYINEYSAALISIARLSWRIWRQHRFEIMHLCNPPDIFFPIAIFYRSLGVRVLFDHHDLFPEMILWRFQGALGRMLYLLARLSEYLTLRVANVVVVPNESYREMAVGRGNLAAERVIVVRNGPKTEEFGPQEQLDELRRGRRHMVCFVGVMGVEDGVLEMVKVIRHIVWEIGRSDIHFALVGDGPIRGEARAMILADDLEAFVEMPGMIDCNETLGQYMWTADILVSPEPLTPLNARSTFIKVGEYMGFGKPIVAFDLPETRYTAQGAACYVTPGDIRGFAEAIVGLLDDPEQRGRMGTLGQKRIVEELGWRHQVQYLFHAYDLARG